MARYKTTRAVGIMDRGIDKNNKEERYSLLLEADKDHDGVLSGAEQDSLKPLMTQEVLDLGGKQIPMSLCVDLAGSMDALKSVNDKLIYIDGDVTVDTAYTQMDDDLITLLVQRNILETA